MTVILHLLAGHLLSEFGQSPSEASLRLASRRAKGKFCFGATIRQAILPLGVGSSENYRVRLPFHSGEQQVAGAQSRATVAPLARLVMLADGQLGDNVRQTMQSCDLPARGCAYFAYQPPASKPALSPSRCAQARPEACAH